LTFDVGENHVGFGLFKDYESYPSAFSYYGCEVVVLDEYVNLLVICPNGPSSFGYDLYEDQGLDSMKVGPLPPSIIKDEPYDIDEVYLSDCYKFVTLILYMPPLNGVENEFDMDVEFDFCEGGLSNGARPTIIMFFGNSLCYRNTSILIP